MYIFTQQIIWHTPAGGMIGKAFTTSLLWCAWFFDIYKQLREIKVFRRKKRRFLACNFVQWIIRNSWRRAAVIEAYYVDVHKSLGCAGYWATWTSVNHFPVRSKSNQNRTV